MTRTRIKFCGFTRAVDIALAAALGVDYVGLILAPRSPRRITLDAARRLRARVPGQIGVVALLMNQPEDEVAAVVDALAPDVLQFHGGETDAFCAAFGVPFWKAIAMGGDPQRGWAEAARYPSAAGWVFDGHAAGESGGSGRRFDWSALAHAARCREDGTHVLLAGGLDAQTVRHAIHTVSPWAVDVSSGIESAPGIKDAGKMRAFVEAVRCAERA